MNNMIHLRKRKHPLCTELINKYKQRYKSKGKGSLKKEKYVVSKFIIIICRN